MNDAIRVNLRNAIVCPNCWTEFRTADIKWISVSDSLIGDFRVGDDALRRFTPTRFNADARALDASGMACRDLACPECHLQVPRSAMFFKPLIISIAGSPGCGKSFYLAAMSWKTRRTLPQVFDVSVNDSDAELNHILTSYESQLFFHQDKPEMVKLAKTDVVGDWYSTIRRDGQWINYPKPFYFDLVPQFEKDGSSEQRKKSRMICLYDNAGESYLPGADTVSSPVTRHLGRAESWLFCYDLTQDPRFRAALKKHSEDIQIQKGLVTYRQEVVLNEMVNRIRLYGKMERNQKTDKPLIVICTKFDAMGRKFDLARLPSPWKSVDGKNVLDLEVIDRVSRQTRKLLLEFCPEIVSVSESLSTSTWFIPVSATGTAPVFDPERNDYLMRSDQIKPVWCEVPMMLTLSQRAPHLIPVAQAQGKAVQ